MAYFITGGTGFVGTEVAAALLRTSDETVYTLVRAADEKTAVHRLKTVWYDMPELYDEIGGRIRPLVGDFLQKDLALSEDQIQGLKGKISRIFHIGAETGIQKSREELMAVNRDGTSNVINFAHAVNQEGSLERLLFVSTALLPWKEKQEEMRYLSFLPLSHVVEGILASYAPYYVHCPVKYYYLNDFNRLTEALPKVRPTVFFSVPRFYETRCCAMSGDPQQYGYP